MKVIGYVRLSTNEQADQGISLDAQEARVQAYCEVQGWTCVEVVRDDGYSAKDLKRPALRCILDEAPSHGPPVRRCGGSQARPAHPLGPGPAQVDRPLCPASAGARVDPRGLRHLHGYGTALLHPRGSAQ